MTNDGFALVIALSLMAFVLVLLLSISALVRVEVSSSANSKAQQLARENARLGMLVALGELQKVMGPDQRVTARADILTGTGGIPENSMNNPYWLGAWPSDLSGWDALDADGRMAAAWWLISGNEGLQPGDANYQTPETLAADSIEMKPAVENYDIAAIVAPRIELEPVSGSDYGHYAYWVSDDNAKALVNLVDPNADSSDEDELNRSFIIPQKTGVDSLVGLENYPFNDTTLERVMDLSSQFESWVSGGSTDASELLSARSYDLTTWAKGLLVDVKDGALKRDLTHAFEVNASFDLHFPNSKFSSQSASDEAAADPFSPEPYYMLEDPIIVSGSPNWSVFRDYYQHYWPATKYNYKDTDYSISTSILEYSHDGSTSNAYKYRPYRSGQIASDPWVGNGLPYQVPYDAANYSGDNYQYNSWVMPVLSQFRISHALHLDSANVDPDTSVSKPILELVVKPVISIYNPYNFKMNTSDFRYRWSLNPKITLAFSSGGSVEFYQNEVQQAQSGGIVRFADSTFSPGGVLHQAYGALTMGGDVDLDNWNSKFNPGVTSKWSSVEGLRLPLDLNSAGYGPKVASSSGAASMDDGSSDPRWGISQTERDLIQAAIAANSGVTVTIDYEDFGRVQAYFNSPYQSQTYMRIDDIWRPGAGAQPTSYSQGYATITAATAQDSFESLIFSLKTTDGMVDSAFATDPLRGLVDMNARVIHANSKWDGSTGNSRFLSIFDADALGQNQMEPEEALDDGTNGQTGRWGNEMGINGQSNVILFDRPRAPLLSIGQLQHANLSRYHFDPTYIVGNSYASLRIPLTETSVTGFGGEAGLTIFDLSYFVNERIWDGFFFSSIEMPYKQVDRDALTTELTDGTRTLSDIVHNPRLEFIDSAEDPIDRYEKIVVRDAADDNFENAIYRPASEMWVNGAFNVNSTSVEAWKAILSSSSNLKIPIYNVNGGSTTYVTETEAVFSRLNRAFNSAFEAGDDSTSSEFWKGYRRLTSDEVDSLATRIVELIQERGPFLSLASFVNRKLEDSEWGKRGLLQAALDGDGVTTGINRFTGNASGRVTGQPVTEFIEATNLLAENLSASDRSNMGFPGFLLQSDILQSLAPIFTVRSDTFTIRSYGDVVDPVTNKVTGRVWCEAKVQRIPDPAVVDASLTDAEYMDELIRPTSDFGRAFKIISFHWLEPEVL